MNLNRVHCYVEDNSPQYRSNRNIISDTGSSHSLASESHRLTVHGKGVAPSFTFHQKVAYPGNVEVPRALGVVTSHSLAQDSIAFRLS